MTVAQKNSDVLAVEQRHAKTIRDLRADKEALASGLRDWAKANREAEFQGEQSLEFAAGWLRYRQGARKLALLADWTWDRVLSKVLSFGETSQWGEYVRRDPQLDAQRLLADTREPRGSGLARLPKALLQQVGLRIEVGESFSIQSKPQLIAVEPPCP